MAIPSTQQKSLQEPSPNQAFFTEASSWKADGLHFTVEWKTLALPAAQWEQVERGWELPVPFTDRWQAEATARALALRSDGDQVYRVVDPKGKVVQVFFVKKYLFMLEEGQDAEQLEEIPAGFDPPMVSQV